MKIDVFPHIVPQKYAEAASKVHSTNPRMRDYPNMMPPALLNLDKRFKIMDMFEDMAQVLTLCEPPIEQITDSEVAVDLAKIANDEMAELVAKYPDRFVAAVAALPMNDVDAALKEVDRAIGQLGLKGVQVYSNVNGKPLDSPEFLPLYEKMAQYDLPIWIHPARGEEFADYKTEDRSRYGVIGMFDWPHETTVAIARLCCSGIMAKYPGLKFITHHCGGTLPYIESRILEFQDSPVSQERPEHAPLTRKLVEYMKMFYADTAIYGGLPTLTCCLSFFGAEHMLFGTDMPMAMSEPGISGVRLAIKGIGQMAISDSDRRKIYEGNARRLLHL
jgi:aminocarboxymuconate-semialdehyde decarboxylase